MRGIVLNQDDFYTNSNLIGQANGTAIPLVYCKVSNEWYNENKNNLPNFFDVEEDGNNLIIINANL